jgi:hypothetical protein
MTMRDLEKPLAASALALEAAAGALCALGSVHAGARAVPVLLAHGLAAVCAAAFLSRRARRLGLGGAGQGAWLLFGTASLVLPVVGPAALVALFARLARGPAAQAPRLVRAGLKDVARAVPLAGEVSAELGRGSLEARLRFDPAPGSRVAAVLATRRLGSAADAVRLLRLALRDRDEDVRLLAHALLEDRDRQAFRRLEELERRMADAPVERRGAVACVVAEALWELCAAGLVSGELESFTLRRARALLEEARLAPPAQASATAALLLGRVLLRQGEARAARAALDESGRLGAPAALLAPALAEAGFLARGRLAPAGESA